MITQDNIAGQNSHFGWLAQKGEGRLAESLALNVQLIESVIYLSASIGAAVDAGTLDELSEHITERAELLTRLEHAVQGVEKDLRDSANRAQIRQELAPVADALKKSDHDLFERLRSQKRSIYRRLTDIHQRKKVAQYLR